MRTILRLGALAVALVILALWFFGGSNVGWTKTSVRVEKTDEVTAQTYSVWEKRFVPGLDFLGGGLIVAGVLGGSSFFFRKTIATIHP